MNDKLNNYFHLQKIMGEATKYCQRIFKDAWANVSKSNSFISKEILKYCNRSENNFKRPQQILLENDDPNEWDLMILKIILSSNSIDKYKSMTKWVNLLAKIRNELASCSDMIINDDKFKKLYNELCSAMKSLGYEQAKLESFKNYDFAINYNINTSTSNNKNIDDKEYDALKESAERECEKKSYLKANR